MKTICSGTGEQLLLPCEVKLEGMSRISLTNMVNFKYCVYLLELENVLYTLTLPLTCFSSY